LDKNESCILRFVLAAAFAVHGNNRFLWVIQ